ncbi:MAG: energy transducer TonB [Planctomycetota bacterium]
MASDASQPEEPPAEPTLPDASPVVEEPIEVNEPVPVEFEVCEEALEPLAWKPPSVPLVKLKKPLREPPSETKPVTTAAIASAPVSATIESEARPSSCPPPDYPRLARRQGQEGTVRVRIYVNAHGDVERVRLERSSGHRLLDRAALDAARGWWFTPATRNGEPVACEIVQPVVFRLR